MICPHVCSSLLLVILRNTRVCHLQAYPRKRPNCLRWVLVKPQSGFGAADGRLTLSRHVQASTTTDRIVILRQPEIQNHWISKFDCCEARHLFDRASHKSEISGWQPLLIWEIPRARVAICPIGDTPSNNRSGHIVWTNSFARFWNSDTVLDVKPEELKRVATTLIHTSLRFRVIVFYLQTIFFQRKLKLVNKIINELRTNVNSNIVSQNEQIVQDLFDTQLARTYTNGQCWIQNTHPNPGIWQPPKSTKKRLWLHAEKCGFFNPGGFLTKKCMIWSQCFIHLDGWTHPTWWLINRLSSTGLVPPRRPGR